MRLEDYPITVSPVPKDEGDGYLVTIPDLPGCIADGATIGEAIAEARDAFEAWTMAEREDSGALPAPKTYSGQFVQRIPKGPAPATGQTCRERRRQPESPGSDTPCRRPRRPVNLGTRVAARAYAGVDSIGVYFAGRDTT